MVTALVFAGGMGERMNTLAKPKQFLALHGKPVIIYTLEHFENHPQVDNIIVVCIAGWVDRLADMLKQYNINKVSRIVEGGDGGDRSIFNGLNAMQNTAEDIVLIHDGVRPLITADLITANIEKVKECGNAITAEPVKESVVRVSRGSGKIVQVPPRNDMYVAKAPQSFRYGQIKDLYIRARREGKRSIDSAHLCSLYGVETFTVPSTPNNLKITNPADYYIFRALFEITENQQIVMWL
ncbi:MAG: 2-C-methyl-D-erythritol 4-phosphate cytidylyltransferase [Defluviitaleaceae bacterium]|nr:2-C-methyl-D-erythritol 4-phosphate cytidylyltransferase [Defluviitaleaceae bacterium]MCL2273909.1 2-C-methyl-D-erythritol 4-phosphate cytidylyltransferase [Defluviitaleaceae bacterium]